MGTGRDAAQLSVADFSQPLHDRDRPLSRTSWAGGQQLLRRNASTRAMRSAMPRPCTDGSWYSGVPLWSLAESQGMRSACLFWPGSEAKIAGFGPATTRYSMTRVDDAQPASMRVLAWLKLPEAERPHFITLYYSEPDHEGHEFGPDAPETKAAVLKMDAMVGKLKEGAGRDGASDRSGRRERSRHGESAGRLDQAGSVCRSDRL